MGKNQDLKDWKKMTKVEQLAYLKKIDSHPNQMELEFENYSFGDTEITRRIFYRINILGNFKPSLPCNLERLYLNDAIKRAKLIAKDEDRWKKTYEAIKVEYSNYENKEQLVKGQINIIYNELLSLESVAKDVIIPYLNNIDFKLSENNIFHSKEAKEGFKHLITDVDPKGLNTSHFKTLWFEYGTNSNRLIIKCKREEYMRYVYDYYLPNTEKLDFTKNRSRKINDPLIGYFKLREKSFDGDSLVYKKHIN